MAKRSKRRSPLSSPCRVGLGTRTRQGPEAASHLRKTVDVLLGQGGPRRFAARTDLKQSDLETGCDLIDEAPFEVALAHSDEDPSRILCSRFTC